MRIVVIGGTGHIGTFLCPSLARQGHEVICVTRGKSRPYAEDQGWGRVRMLTADRDALGREEFSALIREQGAEVVIDLINFTLDDAKSITAALRGQVGHYLYCSSCWAEGRAEILPFDPENSDKHPLCPYGQQKHDTDEYLLGLFRDEGFPVTMVMPGQISGAGWPIVNPWGNRLGRCNEIIRSGARLMLPNFGMETLHHVHGSDVAQVFELCVLRREAALGQRFYAASGGSVTTYGYARYLYRLFGHEPDIGFLPWPEWQDYVRKEAAAAGAEKVESEIREAYLHLARSGYLSTEKAARLLGYRPRYTNLETIADAYRALL
ncbi:MAG: NAD-dependent epimerase/dehydratase family protein [Succinivibrionaceae bacterium]|nr:NAD-dependent epimerase/dehydratase family protein [Succinivibrionaceae bacterium]